MSKYKKPFRWLFFSRRPVLNSGYGLHFCHADKGGHAVLRWEASWRTVNGVVINTKAGAAWVLFRRLAPVIRLHQA